MNVSDPGPIDQASLSTGAHIAMKGPYWLHKNDVVKYIIIETTYPYIICNAMSCSNI